MLKQFISVLLKLYNPIIISVFLLLFILSNINYFHIIPDYLELQNLKNPESYILRLLSISIGFSSIILSIFLIIYSYYSKKIKRNIFEYIMDNPWIKFIFSLFAGSLIFIILSFLFIGFSNNNTKITLLYLSSTITFLNLLIYFPLVILSLKHSNSYKWIDTKLKEIDDEEITNLYSPSSEKGYDNLIDTLEKNKIIQIKDIGVSAIKDNDWSTPQRILNGFFSKLIVPLDINTKRNKLNRNLYAFFFIGNHFKTHIIENNDNVTIKVLLNILYKTHRHFAENKIRTLRDNPIDELIKDLQRLIIENNNFYNLQPYILREGIDLIKYQIKSINYTDNELSTMEYRLDTKTKYDSDNVLNEYWFYLANELPNLFFKVLEHSVAINNSNIYSRYCWQFHSLFDVIYNSNDLTEYQRDELFFKIYAKARTFSSFAMSENIFVGEDIVSSIQIEDWIIHKRKQGFRSLYGFSYLIRDLNKKGKLFRHYIDQFFLVGRIMSGKKTEKDIKVKTFEIIFETGLDIYNENNTTVEVKEEIKRQFNWIKDFINKKELSIINIKYKKFIDKL